MHVRMRACFVSSPRFTTIAKMLSSTRMALLTDLIERRSGASYLYAYSCSAMHRTTRVIT
jgi:hypothetical protein